MLGSLRFRLPALLIAGILLAGAASTAIAVRLYQTYTENAAIRDLKREASGIAGLYQAQMEIYIVNRGEPVPIVPRTLEQATGDQIFRVGKTEIFPGMNSGLKRLAPSPIDPQSPTSHTFTFTPQGQKTELIGVSAPVQLGSTVYGGIVVARPTSRLRSGWTTLIERMGLAFLIGSALAGLLSWRLSRHITDPLLSLSRAADRVAEGQYEVELPHTTAGYEIDHLADRFGEMASRLSEADELERNFLMSVSHELRTPLTAIRGHALALTEGLADDPRARAASLEAIERETARLERLVGDVLDLAKLDAHRFAVTREEVDMSRLCDQAYTGFGEEAKRREIDYVKEIRDRPVILTDGDRALQIISNLLSNAFRWTPDGGRVALELATENGAVRVAIADTGPGIAPSERERIFRAFWSKDHSRGTGLGLAIARELAHALGGKIELQTELGEGSRFSLVLPAIAPEDDGREARQSAQQAG
jgi:signal transduction histidine kinase